MDMETAKKLYPVGCIVRLPSQLGDQALLQVVRVFLHMPGAILKLELEWLQGNRLIISPFEVERLSDKPYREIYLAARVMARMVGKSWDPFDVP